MEALGLLFGLVLLAGLFAVAVVLMLASLEGINMAFRADKTLGVLSLFLVFAYAVYGLAYWIFDVDLPDRMMNALQPKQDDDDEQKKSSDTTGAGNKPAQPDVALRNPDHVDEPPYPVVLEINGGRPAKASDKP